MQKTSENADGKAVKLNELLAAIETSIENCAAELSNIELPGTKGAYYRNMAYEDLKAAMAKVNNLRRQLRG